MLEEINLCGFVTVLSGPKEQQQTCGNTRPHVLQPNGMLMGGLSVITANEIRISYRY